MKPSGLVIHEHKLAYGWKHGFGCGWLPHPVQRFIVKVWNWTACQIFGHDVLYVPAMDGFPEHGPLCYSCCKEFEFHAYCAKRANRKHM